MRNNMLPCPGCAGKLEEARHTIAVLEMEKAREKLKAKTLALRLSRAETLLKRAKEAGYVHA